MQCAKEMSLPVDEYVGLTEAQIVEQMEDIHMLILDLVKETDASVVEIKIVKVMKRKTILFTFERVMADESRREARVQVLFDEDQKSIVCSGFQRQSDSWLHLSELPDVMEFVARRLAPRISVCLASNDVANMLGNIAGQCDVHFSPVVSTIEHTGGASYFVIRRMNRAIRMRLTGAGAKDLLEMQVSDGTEVWRTLECCDNSEIVLTDEQLSKADSIGDYQDYVQNVWGQIFIELGMADLMLPVDQLPPGIQNAISAWNTAIDVVPAAKLDRSHRPPPISSDQPMISVQANATSAGRSWR